MAKVEVHCRHCDYKKVVKTGKTSNGKQRYQCCSEDCSKTFILNYDYLGRLSETKERIVDMAINGSGVRDTARVLHISIQTVIDTLKKSRQPGQSEF